MPRNRVAPTVSRCLDHIAIDECVAPEDVAGVGHVAAHAIYRTRQVIDLFWLAGFEQLERVRIIFEVAILARCNRDKIRTFRLKCLDDAFPSTPPAPVTSTSAILISTFERNIVLQWI